MVTISMRIINKPTKGTRPVFYLGQSPTSNIMLEGTGDADFVCGSCGSLICKSIDACDIHPHNVYLCAVCGNYNEKYCRYKDD